MSEALHVFMPAVAFLLGLGGGIHCGAMCGGIAGALGQSSTAAGASRGRTLGDALLYNTGRISSYAVAGALAGTLGFGIGTLAGDGGGAALRLVLGVGIALTGLVLLGLGRATAPLEALGARFWRRLSPLTARLSSPSRRSGVRLFAVGALWGWLPCGLVYTALTASLATGTPAAGAAFMFAFGLGTLPSMLAATAFAGRVASWLRQAELRRALGVLVLSYGLWTAAGAVWPMHGDHHGSHDAVGHEAHPHAVGTAAEDAAAHEMAHH